MAHFGHFGVEINDEDLLFLKSHKEGDLQQIVVVARRLAEVPEDNHQIAKVTHEMGRTTLPQGREHFFQDLCQLSPVFEALALVLFFFLFVLQD